jgi:DNA repair protein RecO (recombination protein O)
MGKTYKTEGVIIKRLNFGEADRILTLYTKHYGKISALARGVRKLTSRKGGNLELFNLSTLFLARGKNLDIITEVQVKNSFENLKKNFKKVCFAYQLCELVDKLTAENQPNRQLFELFTSSLQNLSAGEEEDQKDLIVKFEISTLELLGFGTPKDKSESSLQDFIENIIEKKIKAGEIFKKLKNS